MDLSFHGVSFGRWSARLATAAVLCQVTNELIHALEVGRIDDEPAVLAARGQSRPAEMSEMKGERCRRKLQLMGYETRGQTLGTRLDE